MQVRPMASPFRHAWCRSTSFRDRRENARPREHALSLRGSCSAAGRAGLDNRFRDEFPGLNDFFRPRGERARPGLNETLANVRLGRPRSGYT